MALDSPGSDSIGESGGAPVFSDTAQPPADPGSQPAPAISSAPGAQAEPAASVTPPPPAAPADAQPGSPAASDPTIRDRLVEYGYTADQLGDATDADILRYLATQAQAVPQLQQYAQLGQQVAPQWDAYQAWQAEQAKAAQQNEQVPPAVESEPYWPVAPDWDTSMERFLTRNDHGDIVVRPEYIGQVNPNLAQQYSAHEQWVQGRRQELFADPAAAVLPGLQPKFDERYATKDDLQAQIQELVDQQFLSSVTASREPDWYELDPTTGDYIKDPSTGKPLLTEYGANYSRDIQFLQSIDMNNPAHRVALLDRLNPHPQATGQQPQTAPPQIAPPQPPTPQQQFVDVAQKHANVPPAQRGGVAGQPTMTNPNDLAPPFFSDIYSQAHG